MKTSFYMDKCFNTITYFDRLQSTNDYIIKLYKELNFKNTLTVFSKQQMKGRGRMGKMWFSSLNQGLTFSFSIKLNSKINLFDLNMFTAFSIVHLLNDMNISASIKYPNDIIYKNKKIAGVLIESIKVSGAAYCVVGVGLNVNNDLFPKQIVNATSLYNITSKFFDVDQVFKLLVVRLKDTMKLYLHNSTSIKKQYFSALWGAQEYVPCLLKNKKVFVKILSITKHGFLSVLIKNSLLNTVNSKDIKFLLS